MKTVSKLAYARYTKRYLANHWSCETPPVCSHRWDDRSWIAHIFHVREVGDPLAPTSEPETQRVGLPQTF